MQYLILYIVEDSSVSRKELEILERFIEEGASLTQEALGGDDAMDIFENKASNLELSKEQKMEFAKMRELLLRYY